LAFITDRGGYKNIGLGQGFKLGIRNRNNNWNLKTKRNY